MTTFFHPTHQELTDLFATAGEAHQRGDLAAAEEGYRQLLQYCPDLPLLHYNLGLVHFQAEDWHSAQACFTRAVALAPDDGDSRFNLALTEKKIGNLDQAIGHYHRLLEREPDCVDALYNLGGCYKDSGRQDEAIDAYRRVLELAPEHVAANSNLAFLCHRRGEVDLAVGHYRRVLAVRPDHPAARHMLAALAGESASSSPESYVREVFEQYSDHYERSLLAELGYCVPTRLRQLLDQHCPEQRFLCGIDLGCGTGLGAQAFAELVEVFDGVDLSPKMLELAAGKTLYRHLAASGIDAFLASTSERYDLALAADVLAYLGDLQNIFSLLAASMRPDGLFLFSTELWSGDGYKLRSTGRFAHSSDYVAAVALASGWRVLERRRQGLRQEQGQWVEGDLWLCRLGPPQNGGGD